MTKWLCSSQLIKKTCSDSATKGAVHYKTTGWTWCWIRNSQRSRLSSWLFCSDKCSSCISGPVQLNVVSVRAGWGTVRETDRRTAVGSVFTWCDCWSDCAGMWGRLCPVGVGQQRLRLIQRQTAGLNETQAAYHTLLWKLRVLLFLSNVFVLFESHQRSL